MNREILFRGKTLISNGLDWIVGHYHEQEDKGNKYYYIDNFGVTKESVGQFTGLCDKNGVKIFEDDLVLIPEGWCGDNHIPPHHAVVIFKDGEFIPYNNDYITPDGIWNITCEVVSNIQDNPDILIATKINSTEEDYFSNLKNLVKNRIAAEYRKHRDLDWQLIAAIKIVDTFKQLKLINEK